MTTQRPATTTNTTQDQPTDDYLTLNGHKVPRCAANNQRGTRCGKPALRGQKVCDYHGGNSPQAKAAAKRRIEMAEAEKVAAKEVVRFGLKRDVSPSQALLDELQWTAGNVEYFRLKAAEVGEERLVMGLSRVVDNPTHGQIKTLEAKPSVWYELWMREREHLVKVAAAAARAGVEQRRIELAESQGMLVADVVRRILDSLLGVLLASGFDLREVWDQNVREIVPREFRAIEAVVS